MNAQNTLYQAEEIALSKLRNPRPIMKKPKNLGMDFTREINSSLMKNEQL